MLATTPTENRDLRGGRSLWVDSPRIKVNHRKTLKNETCDVAVVGAGVSGAIIALTLASAGHDVVVVDRRPPLQGSTIASTAMIQFELDTPLTTLAGKIGTSSANRAYLRSFQAVRSLRKLIIDHKIRCAWIDRDALYLAGGEMGRRGLDQEARCRARIGLPSHFLPQADIHRVFSIDRTGAILSTGAAELDPAQLTAGCLRAAQSYGVRIYSPHEVVAVDATKKSVELHTAGRAAIAARRVVFATGYEVVRGVPKGEYDIISSWALATHPLDNVMLWPSRCLIWEAADPYLYMRTTAGNRIVAGGEDTGLNDPLRRDRAIANKTAALLKKIEDLLPGRHLTVDYAWAGAFADSPTGLPHIAPVEALPNCLAVLGCGGNGITFSMVAAEVASKWVKGQRDPDADLFA